MLFSFRLSTDPNFYADRTNRAQVDPIFTQAPTDEMMIRWNIEGLQVIDHNGLDRAAIYTDGSTLYPLHDMARTSGWGVFVADGSSSNQSQPFYAELQDNYCAELRAVAHTVSVAAIPVIIRVDNKAVVDGFTKLFYAALQLVVITQTLTSGITSPASLTTFLQITLPSNGCPRISTTRAKKRWNASSSTLEGNKRHWTTTTEPMP